MKKQPGGECFSPGPPVVSSVLFGHLRSGLVMTWATAPP